MIKVDLEQGSSQWKLWRRDGIGGSDAPAIMGCGFIDRETLLRQKLTGEEQETNFAMRRGTRLEPVVRRLFSERTGLVVSPVCGVHDNLPWLRCSLDGLTFMEDAFIEMKCPNVVDHEVALAGVVPIKYYPQMQHLLMASGCEIGYYVSYSVADRFETDGKASLAIITVEPDAEYLAKLMQAEEDFIKEWKSRLNQAKKVSA